ncbi:MAG: NADH:ubiquinone oxidoreductase [Thermoplasmata archaeon HGW-Thermoplasmata-1]|nr:MAG: NADH:ubiquinone oxidoreductase [Thermoplasmata archaeon HGW-Thermoplasmata-1]
MSEKSKPRVAIFDFASCEGCELQIANIEEEIIDLVNLVEVVSFREVMKEHSDDYDIAIIEGSIVRPMDVESLKVIRKNAKILIALGACACIGGVNRLRNRFTKEELFNEVYGKTGFGDNPLFDVLDETKPVDGIVPVDYYIPGCPIDRNEFKRVILALCEGKKPELPGYPVCVECKKNENVCVFEKGQFCLGPVTRAGCDAICPSHGNSCEGCRGLIYEPSNECVKEVLSRYGLDYEEMTRRRNMFNCCGREDQ